MSVSLEFEMKDDNGRTFLVNFEVLSPDRNLLMSVIYNGLPLDTTEIRNYDKQLYKDIEYLMTVHAQDHFKNKAA
jgi:hypothetical protein